MAEKKVVDDEVEVTPIIENAEIDANQALADEELEPIEGDEVEVEVAAAPVEGEDLNLEQQDEVDQAKEQFEKTGTWTKDTPKWIQAMVNRTTSQKYRAEEKATSLAEENRKLKEELAKKEIKPLGEKPKLDDFEDDEEFHLALSDWNYDKRRGEELKENQENTTKSQQVTAQKDFEQKADAMLDSGTEKHADFMTVINSVPRSIFTNEVIGTAIEAKNGDDVIYFLGNNLVEAERIAKMNPAQRGIAIGEISAKLAATPTKKITKTPAPITPIDGKSSKTGEVADNDIGVLERVLGKSRHN